MKIDQVKFELSDSAFMSPGFALKTVGIGCDNLLIFRYGKGVSRNYDVHFKSKSVFKTDGSGRLRFFKGGLECDCLKEINEIASLEHNDNTYALHRGEGFVDLRLQNKSMSKLWHGIVRLTGGGVYRFIDAHWCGFTTDQLGRVQVMK